jgi:hypothetical protein
MINSWNANYPLSTGAHFDPENPKNVFRFVWSNICCQKNSRVSGESKEVGVVYGWFNKNAVTWMNLCPYKTVCA